MVKLKELKLDDLHHLTETAQELQIHEKFQAGTIHSWRNSALSIITLLTVISIIILLQLVLQLMCNMKHKVEVGEEKSSANKSVEPLFSARRGEELCGHQP